MKSQKNNLLECARQVAFAYGEGTLYWFNRYYEQYREFNNVTNSIELAIRKLDLMGDLLAVLERDRL